MCKCEVAIVILHYENLHDTEECLDSVLKYLSDGRTHIVAVDNGSKNEKLNDLKRKYNNPKIHFIYNKDNLGFANGNNVGFVYAKHKLKAQIIVLANNDLIFRQEDFIDKLLEAKKNTQFDVAGPRITSLVDGKNQNPVPRIYKDLSAVKNRILKFQALYLLSFIGLDVQLQYKYREQNHENSVAPDMNDFQLHGACMFFSNRFIEKFDGLCDKTFMYGEESILKYQCDKYNLNLCYLDQLEVFHKEGSTTNKVLGSGAKKRQFYYKNNIKGCKILANMMTQK